MRNAILENSFTGGMNISSTTAGETRSHGFKFLQGHTVNHSLCIDQFNLILIFWPEGVWQIFLSLKPYSVNFIKGMET